MSCASSEEHRTGDMDDTHTQQVLRTTRSLRASLLAVVSHVDQLCDLMEKTPGAADSHVPVAVQLLDQPLKIDRATYTVFWGERSCYLGHTMAFRLLERLAQRPNQYLRTDRLLSDLWQASRSRSTVRSTVCCLKAKLRKARMGDLADLIDGSNPDHYGLLMRKR